MEPRWKRGVSVVSGRLGEIIGKVYVEKHFNQDAKDRMLDLVENLREAYRLSIDDLDWMGDSTKKQAQYKLGRFRPKIKFIKILDTQPPTFVLHGNKIDFLSKQYLKYLENSVRKSLQLKGIPIKLVSKIAENPYKTRKNKLTKRQLNKRKRIRGR